MHPVFTRERLTLAGLVLALIPLYFLLPWAGQGLSADKVGMYASPDETSNAVVARQLAWYGRLSVEEPLVAEFPWIHPRSTVSQNEAIVPVGFTGWPWIISVFSIFLGQGSVPFLATLLLLSAAIPLFALLRPFGFRAAWLGTLVAMSFPGMIVFANRGLFPQVAVVGFAIWSVYFITRLRSNDSPWMFGLVGFLVTLAAASRPTELFWLLPWFVWAGRALRPDRKRLAWACAGALIPLTILAFHAQMSYGAFWKSGYMIRDNPPVVVAPETAVVGVSVDETKSLLFPYGFHPRNVLWNARAFLLGILFPWTVVLFGALVIVAYDARNTPSGFPFVRGRENISAWKRLIELYAVPLLCLWTVSVLVGYYGHGLYTDHVQIGAVTIANSFVRYLLPIGPIIGLAFAFLFSRLEKKRFGVLVGILLAVGLAGSGTYAALAQDDEGMLVTRRELTRYRDIRDRAAEHFEPTDVILSERSDKIFFPKYRAVSPLPPTSDVARLAKAHPELKIGLFARPLSQVQVDEWRMAGFEPVELFVSGREKLYLMQVTRRK
ncbi:MAG: hypothetical protein AAB668_01905 [Patescibacteria group bacterium]